MKPLATLLLLSLALSSFGCAAGSSDRTASVAGVGGQPNNAPSVPASQSRPADGSGGNRAAGADFKQVSLSQADAAQAPPVPSERKIIRNATMTVETETPSEAMRRVSALAEARGGFVVTSESQQHGGYEGVRPYEVVTVEVRIPAGQFETVVQEIRGVGARVASEKLTGQDVTEEYIDLEARIRTQRALEAQFLEIMKGAETVEEALQVQRELAEVRTEIERVEGRRRFLENQTSLSTIKVTLQPPAPLVNASGFGYGLRDAFGDGVGAALGITLGLVRVFIALIPVALFVGVPLYFLTRYAIRRVRRRRPPAEQLP